jgi:hypothetical protein
MCVAVFNPREDSDLFTVEVVYNGFFYGLRENLSYVSASIAHLTTALLTLGP